MATQAVTWSNTAIPLKTELRDVRAAVHVHVPSGPESFACECREAMKSTASLLLAVPVRKRLLGYDWAQANRVLTRVVRLPAAVCPPMLATHAHEAVT